MFADVLIGLADDEDPVEGNFQRGIAFAQDFEHLDDLAGVVEFRFGINPEQHPGQLAFVELRILLEHRGEEFERGSVIAIVEVTLAEGEPLADIHNIFIGRFLTGGEHGERRRGPHRNVCRIADFADDAGQDAKLAGHVTAEIISHRGTPVGEVHPEKCRMNLAAQVIAHANGTFHQPRPGG